MADQSLAKISTTTLVSTKAIENIRWIALFGQVLAIMIVQFGFNFDLPLTACLLVIALSAGVGFAQNYISRMNKNVSIDALFGLLVFDVVQLALLLYLTGGLINPFAIMFMAPVVISATVMSQGRTMILVSIVVVLASILASYHDPLPWGEAMLDLPTLYVVGLWAALVLTTIFIATYAGMVARQSRDLARGLAEARVTMAQEQQMVALGSLATAAAHKLGSPLNTITLIAHELGQMDPKKDFDLIKEDLNLLQSETDRCREILAELNHDAVSLGSETDDPMPIKALFNNLIDERFADIKSIISLAVNGQDNSQQPEVMWRPDLLHPLETLIDNAAQFAKSKVEIAVTWDDHNISVLIQDDGPGFQSAILSRLGEPYNSSRSGDEGHMGLGVFIAKTMIENNGGKLKLVNKKGGKGAQVTVIWPRQEIDSLGIKGNRTS